MTFRNAGRRHPSRDRLVSYAEALVDGNTTVLNAVATHVARCAACAQEVRTIQDSLALSAAVRRLEHDGSLVASILIEAKKERQNQLRSARRRAVSGLLRGAVFLLLLLTVGFLVVDGLRGVALSAREAVTPVAVSSEIAAESDRAVVGRGVALLRAAIETDVTADHAPTEWAEVSRLLTHYQEMQTDAQRALQRNPASVRAAKTFDLAQKRELELLRGVYLYEERP